MVHSTPSTYNENKAANLEIVIQEFYSILLEKASSRPSLEKASSSEVSPSLENASSSKDSKEKKSSKVSPSNVVHYQNAVFDLLYFHKSRVLSESDLEELQCKIESMTCGYEAAANIYQQSPNLLKKLISMNASF